MNTSLTKRSTWISYGCRTWGLTKDATLFFSVGVGWWLSVWVMREGKSLVNVDKNISRSEAREILRRVFATDKAKQAVVVATEGAR